MTTFPIDEAYYVDFATMRNELEEFGIAPSAGYATVQLFRDLRNAESWATGLAPQALESTADGRVCIWKVDLTGIEAEYEDDLDDDGPDAELLKPETIPPERLTFVTSL